MPRPLIPPMSNFPQNHTAQLYQIIILQWYQDVTSFTFYLSMTPPFSPQNLSLAAVLILNSRFFHQFEEIVRVSINCKKSVDEYRRNSI